MAYVFNIVAKIEHLLSVFVNLQYLASIPQAKSPEVMSAADGRKVRSGVDKIVAETEEKMSSFKRPKPRSTNSTVLTRDLEAMNRADDPEMYDMVEADRDAALAWQQCDAFRNIRVGFVDSP